MSSTIVIYPIMTALIKAEDILGQNRTWRAVSHTQAFFLDAFFKRCREEGLLIPEIESIASWNIEDIHNFLRQRGYTIQLAPFQRSSSWTEFGVASALDLFVEWLKPGNETTLEARDRKSYPAVQISEGVSFHQARHHPYAVVQLQSTSGDRIYLTRLDQASTGFELLQYAAQLSGSLRPIFDYDGLVFPMVNLKQAVDVKWLLAMETISSKNEPVKIMQALQETHFTMGPEGARAKSAVAMAAWGCFLSQPLPKLIIDEPFLVWCERPGLSTPLFVGHITQEDWRNPGKVKKDTHEH